MKAIAQRQRRWVAVMVGASLLAGCTGWDEPGDGGGTSPSPTPLTSPSQPMPEPPTATGEFADEPPEEPCPPASALRLPSAEDYPYAVTVPFLDEEPGIIEHICNYELAGTTDDEQDMVLADHVWIGASITLFPSAADAYLRENDNLPLVSDDLAAWEHAANVASGGPTVVWEGCGPATPCTEGDEPTVRTHAMTTEIDGRVENLQFFVSVTYTAENLPADVERRSLEIYRDLVLALVATRERAD